MIHYLFTRPVPRMSPEERQGKWQTFAAFITFAALVALAGATYGSLRRGDVYAEVQKHHALQHFAGVLEASERLPDALQDKSRSFTLIAPSDSAFEAGDVLFAKDEAEHLAQDKHVIRLAGDERSYLLQGEDYVLSRSVRPHEVPEGRELKLSTVNGEAIALSRDDGQQHRIMVNGIAVRDQIPADNGIIYIVDKLVYPLPDAEAPARN